MHTAGASAVPGCTEVVADDVTISGLPLSGSPGGPCAVHDCPSVYIPRAVCPQGGSLR